MSIVLWVFLRISLVAIPEFDFEMLETSDETLETLDQCHLKDNIFFSFWQYLTFCVLINVRCKNFNLH